MRSLWQYGWPLRSIHISNDNWSFTFYLDVFFLPSLPRLLPDLVTRRVSYKKQELLAPEFKSDFLVGSLLLIFVIFCVVLLCVFTFWVPRCDVRYDFGIKTMFGSSFPQVVCRRVHVLFTYLCLFTCSNNHHILCSVLFVFVFCTLCCQFLWIVYLWSPIRYSLTFINDDSWLYLSYIMAWSFNFEKFITI